MTIISRGVIIFLCVLNCVRSNLNYQVVKVYSGTDTSNSTDYEFYLLSNGIAKVYLTFSSIMSTK